MLWQRFTALASWQRYLLVTVLSFPLALGIREVLIRVLPEDLAAGAIAVVRKEKERPLSEPLARILADTSYTPRATQPHPLLGQVAADFALRNCDGQEISLARLRQQGPVVVIFYYGYYCPHCVSQLFGINEDVALFNELGVHIVALSSDPPEMTAKQFKKYGRFGFEVVSDPEWKVAQAYGVYHPETAGQPESLVHATFLVGKDGHVFWANTGPEPFLDNKTLLRELAEHCGLSPEQPRLADAAPLR
jgi:thioredoxin-dependent peroxiredoxin